ncbi:hypothetical protein NODU109028_19055 [Nocardioides dubius]|uniref:Sulfotransferase family protein n=1 Tax=Nocardioides dubius TaxID=317019 RepID=A0ABP4EDJ7_9ACTN
MTRRLYLHIGLLKTGTTFLQDGLWMHKEELGRRGVLVPGRHRRRHLIASLDLRDDPKLARRAGDVSTPWQDLVDEAREWDGHAAVISHEFFAPAAVEHIQRAADSVGELELHVVITARVLTELAPSLWQEWVKNGGQRGIEGFPGKAAFDPHDEWGWAAFDLADVLERWSQVVPAERIHILPMRAGAGRTADIWERFLEMLDVAPAELPAPEEAVNVSLGVVEIEALRRINMRLEDFDTAGDRSRWIRTYLASTVMPNERERFRPSEKRWNRLVAKAQHAVQILEGADYDVRGDLADLVPEVALPDLRHPRDVTEGEMLAVTTQTIATMLTDVRERNRERFGLWDQIAEQSIPPLHVRCWRRLIRFGKDRT